MDKTKENTMKIRLATQEDLPRIKELAFKSNIAEPKIGTCFVAERDGEVLGYINGGVIGFIESIVSDEPIAMMRLFSAMEGLLMSSNTPIFASVVNDEAGELLKRAGFNEQFNHIFMKKM